MKVLLYTVCLVCSVYVCKAQTGNAGNCTIPGVESANWQSYYINDDLYDYETLHKQFEAANHTITITVATETHTYLSYSVSDDNELIVETKDEFSNYEQNEASTSVSHFMDVSLILLCQTSDTSTLRFRQPITDTNNHAPDFDNSTYTYKIPMPLVAGVALSTFGSDITVTDVDITNTAMSFQLDTDDFTISTDGPLGSLNKQYKPVIVASKALRYTSTQTFTITATDAGTNPGPLSSTATLIIEVDDENSYPESPSFEQPYYTATYTSDTELHFVEVNGPISLSSTYENVNVYLEGEYQDNFDINLIENDVIVTLKTNLLDDVLESETTLVLVIVARIEDADSEGKTALIISLPQKECDEITTTTTTTTTAAPTDPPITTECPVCDTTPTFTTTISSSTSATTCEECPECPNISTTPTEATPTEPVTTPSTTTPQPSQPAPSIQFEQTLYRYAVQPTFVGSIGTVTATSTVEEDEIRYSITDSDGALPTSVTIDQITGEISNIYYLSNGVNYFIIYAIGSSSEAVTEANVLIIVESISVCDDEVRSGYSVLVKHIVEEESNYDIVVFDEEHVTDGFRYVLYEQYPTNGTGLFEINPETGNLQSFAIDREWSVIHSMYLPQFTVTLRLVNETEETRRKRSFLEDYLLKPKFTYDTDGDRTWAYVEDQIINLPNQVVVYVVVDDINDNSPVFEKTDFVVGYPSQDLALEILPPYVTVVQASDIDEGYNASIYYSTDSDYFYVHPITGVVYPTGEVFESSELTFTVSATDRNGTGRTTQTNITVKLLTSDKILVLTTSNMVLEDLDEQLSDLSSSTGLTINYLTASVVSSSAGSARMARETSGYYLRIVAYGLDSNDDPVSASIIEDAFDDLDLDETWTVQSWESYSESDSTGDDMSTLGLIVAVSVLAVMLVLFISAVFAFYYFKIRKVKYDRMVENREASPIEVKAQPDQLDVMENESPKGFRKNPKLQSSVTKNIVETPSRRLTGNILYLDVDRKSEDSNDDVEIVQPTGESINPTIRENGKDPSPPRERKKSVAFNDTVEKLHIETDEVENSKL